MRASGCARVRVSPSAPLMPGCPGGEQRAAEGVRIKFDKLPLFTAELLRAIRAWLRQAA